MKKYSEKTLARIEAVNTAIKAHRKNIKALKLTFVNTPPIQKGTFAPRIVKYSAIPYSEERFRWTIQNLESQIKELEKELLILNEYGA